MDLFIFIFLFIYFGHLGFSKDTATSRRVSFLKGEIKQDTMKKYVAYLRMTKFGEYFYIQERAI